MDSTIAISRQLRRWLWLAGLVSGVLLSAARTAAAGAPRFTTDTEAIERVVALIERRLAIMPEVAALKFQQQRPIADPARERVVLDQSVAEAQAMNLDGDSARAFFAVQIGMARAVQAHLVEHWRATGQPPPPARDLVRELRPQLDVIGRELLPAAYLASAALVEIPHTELRARLARLRRLPGVTDDQLDELARALGALRIVAPATWGSVQRVGFVRVGTTGDYAPFSDDRGGELRGLDIHLAESLAKAWGVTAVFVRTTWPTLMGDLARGRFDLALSGISITAERREQAAFSTPYLFDGKTPIARRDDAARFSSLDRIDQPGVRVVVNPGGTNERFVREHLRRATILVHPDNRTIFAEIVAGRADVMITDGIEVRLQTRRHPELQATMSAPLTRTGKAFLLPRDSELTPRIDAWLEPQRERGEIAAQLERALAAPVGVEAR